MTSNPNLSEFVQEFIWCPICNDKLSIIEEEIVCTNPNCNSYFPIVDGIPVLLNEESSIFSINDYVSHKNTTFQFDLSQENKIKRFLKRIKPSISKNIKAKQNYISFASLLFQQAIKPNVLIVGGSILGEDEPSKQ